MSEMSEMAEMAEMLEGNGERNLSLDWSDSREKEGRTVAHWLLREVRGKLQFIFGRLDCGQNSNSRCDWPVLHPFCERVLAGA
jgi:hypothetical protein